VDSITNSAVMVLDKVFRANDIPFAHRHHEARALLLTLVASAVADHEADIAREALDKILDKAVA
jgi:antitoxin component of RelBE/YafQ-DinJ toxin-antitoxin module